MTEDPFTQFLRREMEEVRAELVRLGVEVDRLEAERLRRQEAIAVLRDELRAAQDILAESLTHGAAAR